MASCSAAKRSRKPNWVTEEIRLLLQELQIEGRILFGANTPANTTKIKNQIWGRIANTISAVGVAHRTAEEIKLKWKGLKKEVIEKDFELRKTGGGQPQEKHLPYEEMVRAVIGEKSNLYRGIEVPEPGETIVLQDCGGDEEGERDVPAGEVAGNSLVNLTIPVQEVPSIIELPLSFQSGIPSTSDVGFSSAPVKTPQNKQACDTSGLPSTSDVSISPVPVPDLPKALGQSTSASPVRPMGLKARLLRKRRSQDKINIQKRAADNIGVEEEEESEEDLFKEYLKSEIKKNNIIIEKTRKEVALMEEKEKREVEKEKRDVEESKVRLLLHRKMIQKLSSRQHASEENCNEENFMTSFGETMV